MDKLASLQFFVRVVESGSFSKAARELGVGQPAVSKQVAALEQRLGAQLLSRTSRGLRPTPSGADFYESALQVLRDLDDAESRVANNQGDLKGIVRIAVPPMMTGMMIVPKLPDFYQSYPGIAIEFVVAGDYADLVQGGLDLAIRIGNLNSSGLLARKIGSMQFSTFGSSGYLARNGTPSQPSDLNRHHLIASRFAGSLNDWQFANSEPASVSPRRARFICNEPADLRAAVVAGLGLAQIANGVFDSELRAGLVVEVLKDFAPAPLPVHALCSDTRIPRRVQAVRDFIAQCVSHYPGFRL